MKKCRLLSVLSLLVLCSITLQAQVAWTWEAWPTKDNTWKVYFFAEIEKGWRLPSQIKLNGSKVEETKFYFVHADTPVNTLDSIKIVTSQDSSLVLECCKLKSGGDYMFYEKVARFTKVIMPSDIGGDGYARDVYVTCAPIFAKENSPTKQTIYFKIHLK